MAIAHRHRPFALLAILLFYRLYSEETKKIKDRWILTLVLIISCIMKPLFAMAFVPAGGILLFMDAVRKWKDGKMQFGKLVKDYIQMVWPLILTGFFLIGQYLYGQQMPQLEGMRFCVGDESHIRFGFMYAWSIVVSNVWLSILYAYFFPIVVFALNLKYKYVNKSDIKIRTYAKICFAYMMVSFGYISCMYQDNGYEDHLNFRNAWIISFNIVYCLAMVVLYKGIVKWKKDKSKDLKAGISVGIGALAVHVIFGLVLLGQNILL